MLNSAHFEFDSVIHCNFCSFLGFIYLLMLICGSFTLGRLFYFSWVLFLFNGVLFFSLKNSFCGYRFKINVSKKMHWLQLITRMTFIL